MDNTNSIKILFVDDEARVTRSLAALFRDHNVTTANDPQHAATLTGEDFDVIVCDQRMPKMKGIEVLREFREHSPRTMRILLTGYSDLQSIIGSINEGEVFRFVNKPWTNSELRATVAAAADIARSTPVVEAEASEVDKAEAREQAGVLIIEDDVDTQRRLREILSQHYHVRFAQSAANALKIMEQFETGVLISETEADDADLTAMLKALKKYHPAIASIVITEKANAQLAIDLINEGQVYRLLLKPVRDGSTRLSVESAIGRYWSLKKNPKATRRFSVGDTSAGALAENLLDQIRRLPNRLMGFGR